MTKATHNVGFQHQISVFTCWYLLYGCSWKKQQWWCWQRQHSRGKNYHRYTYQGCTDEPWHETQGTPYVAAHQEAKHHESNSEPEMVICLWGWHHLDGLGLLWPHWLEFHHIGGVGGLHGCDGLVARAGLEAGVSDERSIIMIIFLCVKLERISHKSLSVETN